MDENHACVICLDWCRFAVALICAIVYIYVYSASIDGTSECCASADGNVANYTETPAPCNSTFAVTNVNSQFDLFLLLQMILSIALLLAVLMLVIDLTCKFKNSCHKWTEIISGLIILAQIIVYIIGALWRWSLPGRICAGSFLEQE
jgi:hypothetical protein